MSATYIDAHGFWLLSRLSFGINSKGELNVTEKERKDMHIEGNVRAFSVGSGAYTACVANISDYVKSNGHVVEGGVVVSFRGTDFNTDNKSIFANILDLVSDIDAIKQNCIVENENYGPVHQGFYLGVGALNAEGLENEVNRRIIAGAKRVYIVGHSKGGAMANLFAMYAAKLTDKRKITVVTYGAPRCGTFEFKKHYDIETYSYRSFADIVPHLPFTKKETDLFTTISPLEAASQWISKFVDGYTCLGKHIDVNVPHPPYTNLARFQENSNDEILNSACVVERMFRNKEFNLFASSHNDDYTQAQDIERSI